MTAAARAAIAAAASSLDGISCSAYYRQSFKPGDAMVRLAGRGPDPELGSTDTWQVYVALSQDVATAEKWLDAHLGDLETALAAEMTVTSITPTEFVTGSTSVNGVVVEGDREA